MHCTCGHVVVSTAAYALPRGMANTRKLSRLHRHTNTWTTEATGKHVTMSVLGARWEVPILRKDVGSFGLLMIWFTPRAKSSTFFVPQILPPIQVKSPSVHATIYGSLYRLFGNFRKIHVQNSDVTVTFRSNPVTMLRDTPDNSGKPSALHSSPISWRCQRWFDSAKKSPALWVASRIQMVTYSVNQ